MRKFAAVMLCSGMVLSASTAWAQSVAVSGNSRVDSETIRSYLSLSPGESYNAARIDQAIKDLYATGLFSDVKIRRDGGRLVVSVVENSVINRVTFEGNSKVKDDVLIGEVQSRSRGPFSQSMVSSDVERIKDLYRRSGRNEATVTSSLNTLQNGRVDVVFKINEGGKTGVNSINFSGNQAYANYKLKNVMTTTESNLLSFLKTSDIYDPERLSSDLELIRRFYLKNGYADFRVVSSNAQYNAEKQGYDINIVVDEGQRYTVVSSSVDSRLRDVDSATLQGVTRTSSGQIYNADAVEKSVEAISGEVAKRGYAFAQVRPRGDRDPASRTVAIVYAVEEGPRVYVERINVRGNTRTRDYVVRREFDMGEGDAYNKVLVDRAERRLNNLGYFKKVKISNEQGSSPDRVIVNVDVEDQPTGSFQIAGGYSTSDGVLAEVSLSESNFMGRGQYVRVGVTTGQRSKSAELSFTEPYFLGQRIAAGFDLFTKYSDNTRTSRYETRMTGGTIRAAVAITDEFSIGARYSLYQQQIKIPNTVKQPYNDCSAPIAGYTAVASCLYDGEASIAIKEAVGKTVTSIAGLTFVYSTLDNAKNPTSGLYAELRPEIAGLGGDAHFGRISGNARYYTPITDDIVGMLKVQGGHMNALGGKNVRMIDHFFMGPDLVRGFAPSGLGPRDMSYDPRNGSVGGTTYFGVTAEAVFPIFGLPKELGLKGAVFADAGTLYGYKGITRFDVNNNGIYEGTAAGCTASATVVQAECMTIRDKHKIRTSVGAGVLWDSPLGPIRFDYAFALSKDQYDRKQAFRFSGGTRF